MREAASPPSFVVRSAFRRIPELAITGPRLGAGAGSIRTALDLGDFEVNTTAVYSSKAIKYAKYRWDYAPCAIQTICDVASLSAESVVADIGAGTGILARHFVGTAGRVFAVEPNAEMRRVVAQSLAQFPSCHVINGRAEATTLSDCSIDLITVAQAIHWFEPEPTRAEFLRIIKPQGWLAVLRNNATDAALSAAIENALVREHGIDTSSQQRLPGKEPMRFYFGSDAFQRSIYPFAVHQTWQDFIGSLSTASYFPEENDPVFPEVERALRGVFDSSSSDGVLTVHAATELCLGQIVES